MALGDRVEADHGRGCNEPCDPRQAAGFRRSAQAPHRDERGGGGESERRGARLGDEVHDGARFAGDAVHLAVEADHADARGRGAAEAAAAARHRVRAARYRDRVAAARARGRGEHTGLHGDTGEPLARIEDRVEVAVREHDAGEEGLDAALHAGVERPVVSVGGRCRVPVAGTGLDEDLVEFVHREQVDAVAETRDAAVHDQPDHGVDGQRAIGQPGAVAGGERFDLIRVVIEHVATRDARIGHGRRQRVAEDVAHQLVRPVEVGADRRSGGRNSC